MPAFKFLEMDGLVLGRQACYSMTNLTLIQFVPFGRSDTETEIGLSCKNRPFVLPLVKTGQLDVVKHAAVCDLENFAASS